jgi:hypothetical protein
MKKTSNVITPASQNIRKTPPKENASFGGVFYPVGLYFIQLKLQYLQIKIHVIQYFYKKRNGVVL